KHLLVKESDTMILGEVSQADQIKHRLNRTKLSATARSPDRAACRSNRYRRVAVTTSADQAAAVVMPQANQTVTDQVATTMSLVDQVAPTPSMDHAIHTNTDESHHSSNSETE
ncbi:hypothetical protein HAX54_001806, partial [Datura stramonium]|nr:hypothetical protein [Datura stramonium]